MEEALAHCRTYLGGNVTILYDDHIPSSIVKMVKEEGKKAGGAWECCRETKFYGWEAEKVVAVTDGDNMMEMITRVKTCLRLTADICRKGPHQF